jgi:UDP-glucose 4-epimerase
MRVLVAGISGALARRVALLLRDAGHEVLGLDRRPWWDHPRDLEVFEVDIRKRAAEDIFRTRRPDCVVHMATVNALSAAGEERARINVGGTRALFEHSVGHGVKHIVFVGRHTYYGASDDSPLYHTENEPPMGMGAYPELADLVAADLYAANMLWREPTLTTTILRLVYTLGPAQTGTLASFLKGRRVPMVLGFDPLFHFLEEEDAARAVVAAVEARPKGIFNVAGPSPMPLSTIIEETGRSAMPLPEPLVRLMRGRLGLPALPQGAVDHLKFPIVVDSKAFHAATRFVHEVGEVEVLRRYRRILGG